jgi:hypothetical protein
VLLDKSLFAVDLGWRLAFALGAVMGLCTIVSVLRREGPLATRHLREHVEARLWGPGRFSPALRRAVREGRVRRVGRRTWAAVG